jgi:uncharacterized protein (DUF2141 family)
MKTLIQLFFLLPLNLGLAREHIQSATTGTIQIQITGLRSNDGEVKISLFNKKEGFPSDSSKAIKQVRLKIEKNHCEGSFQDLPLGDYAIAGYHDENKDGMLNFNLFHVPKEGVCASNNAKGNFGPPSYEDAKFSLDSALVKISMKMSY